MTDYAGLPHADGRWRFERWLIHVERWGTYLFLIMVVGLVILQVATRYALSSPPLWTEEFARYSLVWVTFLGAAWLVAINDHITVHGVDLLLGARGKAVLDGLVQLVQAAVAIVIVVSAPDFLERVSKQHSAAGALSMGWVYGSVVVGFSLIAIHSVLVLVKDYLAASGRGGFDHLHAQGVYEAEVLP
ncbi:TRAP transporter small permease [Microbacterium sp. NPDC055910]|uniref:TRAP transporter small permease n=1 Tax=Microbacterium sp. NPDC055910 TaxID=3345659 RepID=UPI0035D7BFE7